MNRHAPTRRTSLVSISLGVAFVITKIAILILAYFGSAIAPVSFIDASPITFLDLFPDQYWQWQPGYWLTPGHLILILSWPMSMMAGRVLGRSPAALTALIAWLLVGSALGFVLVKFGPMFTVSPLPPTQVTIAFIIAMPVAEFMAWRGFIGYSSGPADAVLGAALYSILFNALTYGLDPAQGGPRLVIQTLLYGIAAWVIATGLSPLVRPRYGR